MAGVSPDVTSIRRAESDSDYELAAAMLAAFGEWDASQAEVFGVPPEIVKELFHNGSAADLKDHFNAPGSALHLACSGNTLVGCLGYGDFADDAVELHKFYVDPSHRGARIGTRLMTAAMDEIAQGPRRKVVLHTTEYMTSALTLYAGFGFSRCPPFRAIPDSIRHTEVFMARQL